jgi:uncharacterized protein (TIGR02099 family)
MLTITINKILRIALVILAILLTIAISIALFINFYIFPNINTYKDDIANKITEQTKLNVHIGNIQVNWKDFDPHLTFADITIFDAENRPALALHDTEILVSWLSIPKMELHLSEIILRKPELTIRRLKTGEIFIAGISIEGNAKPNAANWLIRQSEIKVLHATIDWIDETRNAPTLSLNDIDINLSSPPWKSILKQHDLTLSATPSIGNNKPILIDSHFYGSDISKLNEWGGVVNLTMNDVAIPDFKQWVDFPFEVYSGAGNVKVSTTVKNLQIENIASLLDLNKVSLQVNSDHPPIILDKIAGAIDWKKTSKSYNLALKNVDIKQADFSLNHINASYSNQYTEKSPLHSVSVKLDKLNLKNINHVLALLPQKTIDTSLIAALSPSGTLTNLNVDWSGTNERTNHYEFATKFNALGLIAHEKIPGFTNLSGEIKATEEEGSVKLNSTDAILNFQALLREPLVSNSINAKVAWSLKDQGQDIKIEALSIKNPDLSGELSGSLSLDPKGGHIDLNGLFQGLQLKNAHHYFPTILNEDTLSWLDKAFLAGVGNDVHLTLKGPLNAFPYVDEHNELDLKKGLFRVTAKINEGKIHYGDHWPDIEHVNLDMLFEGDRMKLSNSRGNIFANQIENATIIIPSLDTPEPHLTVDGVVTGLVSEGIAFINQSPVAKITQGFTDDLITSGNGLLKLKLDIPLKHSIDALIEGDYQFTNASMASDAIPEVSNINGNLKFTNDGLFAKNVNANIFSSPVVFDIRSGAEKSIYIDAKGTVSPALVSHFVANPEHYITGSSDLSAKITIKKPDVNITVQSNLLGITSYLPSPFNKNANTPLAFKIVRNQSPLIEEMRFTASNLLAAKMLRKRDNANSNLERVNVYLNQNPNSNADSLASQDVTFNDNTLSNQLRGITIQGNLDYLDQATWLSVYKDTFPSKDDEASLPIQKLDFKVKKLDIFDKRFNDVEINKKSNEKGFTALVKSREMTGALEWESQHNGKLIAKLSQLIIPEASTKTNYYNPLLPIKTEPTNKINLEEIYPAIDITAKTFFFKNKPMGELALVANPKFNDWEIEKLKLINPDSILSATGSWKNIHLNPSTQFKIEWDISNLGKTLDKLGYPETIKDARGTVNSEINWPGSPGDFEVLALNGNLKFEMRSGEFLKVKPGVGKLLGLVSLQSLPRRLTLDFRDLFSNGFVFDKIKANIAIEKGIMRSDNLRMYGPAADVEIKGEANLNEETQHLYVKVLPQISDSLSLAALAGGPLAGAIAFLAQKVLKDPLNKIISSEYEIIGTWDNPEEVKSGSSTNTIENQKGLK